MIIYVTWAHKFQAQCFFFFFFFFWLPRVFTVALRLFIAGCSMQTYLPCGMWDLSSPTRDWTQVPCFGRQIINHWTTKEVPGLVFWQEHFRPWITETPFTTLWKVGKNTWYGLVLWIVQYRTSWVSMYSFQQYTKYHFQWCRTLATKCWKPGKTAVGDKECEDF